MNHLVASGQVRSVHDTIERQIHDLVRARARRAILPDQALQEGRDALLGGQDPAAYGRWVFYPWSGRLVHLLPPPEFAELRLDRNRHKITAAEQARLARFHVGVVGLAGGSAAACTLALEGGFGHLKLADYDALSLSALNRVRAGVHDLGTSKAVLAARQVYEADPYASVELFPDGVDAASLDAFLAGLHAVVDACDDLHIKLLLRERARERRIAVLSETGERGTLDVERFDLEPARPVFHGRLLGLRADDVRRLDEEERAGLLLAVVGADTVSMRAAASLVELRRTVSAWPRLGSDAALAGATLTVALRRLALGEPLPRGRRQVDAAALLAGPEPARAPSGTVPFPAPTLAGVDGRIPELVRFCVEHGMLAPSAGNRQPWGFNWDGERLWVLLDRARAASVVDPHHRAAHLAVGAALENVAVAAAHRGWRAKAEPFPRPRDPSVVAAVTF
ncbi:MAG TPA: ThiF family adenylyltransferase, partial [Longimicrobium sp.]|nr:ThiF family adenylyltransferase [Longimicrobium sp.]